MVRSVFQVTIFKLGCLFYVVCYTCVLLAILGNMVPRKEPDVPPQVKMARQLLTTLGDYTQMGPDDVLKENIEALAQALADSGVLSTSMFLI